ncbi:MAG: tetratricopeptide repeat protein [Thermoanaerobaculia bacterium]|nr:tetratricopeptide repeat protein [Thermoanaerobaculia bacterium]
MLDVLNPGAERIEFDLEGQPELKASLQHTIGSIYTRLGLYDDATPLLAAALAYRRSHLGPESPVVADSWHEWSTLQYARGDLGGAASALEHELKIREREGDPVSLARALHLERLIAGAAGRRAEKAVLHERVLRIQQVALGDDHRETIRGMRQLAAAKRLLGDRETAILLGREALAAQERLHHGDHPVTATMKHDLSKALLRLDRFDEALSLAREALAMQQRLYGELHSSCVRSKRAKRARFAVGVVLRLE